VAAKRSQRMARGDCDLLSIAYKTSRMWVSPFQAIDAKQT
jgi:hypothetical protein